MLTYGFNRTVLVGNECHKHNHTSPTEEEKIATPYGGTVGASGR